MDSFLMKLAFAFWEAWLVGLEVCGLILSTWWILSFPIELLQSLSINFIQRKYHQSSIKFNIMKINTQLILGQKNVLIEIIFFYFYLNDVKLINFLTPDQYYNTIEKAMTNMTANCLTQCLRSCGDEDLPHKFKLSKGQKCLTLVKKLKNDDRSNKVETEGNYPLQTTHQEPIDLQKKYYVNKKSPYYISVDKYQPQKIQPQTLLKDDRKFPIDFIKNRPDPSNQQHNSRRSRLSCIPINIRYANKSVDYQSKSYEARQNSEDKSNRSLIMTFQYINRNIQNIQNKEQNTKQNNHSIFTIKQQSESYKRSSLFQGARGIISKLIIQHKAQKEENQFGILQTAQKIPNEEVRNFYNNARFCHTENGINYTNSTIKSELQPDQILKFESKISIDAIPMSPKSKNMVKYKDFKMGKLLGVGKYSHVYLCQQSKTGSIFALKDIFKQSLRGTENTQIIMNKINHLIELDHPKIINTFAKFEIEDKICIVMEYSMKNVYEQLTQRKHFNMAQIKRYLSNLIEAIVFLHENDIIHGNINIFQTFINFDQCKLKHNIFYRTIQQKDEVLDFRQDISNLAIIAFQMAYGISSQSRFRDTLYEKQRLYKDEVAKGQVLGQINNQLQAQNRQEYQDLNDLIKLFLNWIPNTRLTTGFCFNHAFFKPTS